MADPVTPLVLTLTDGATAARPAVHAALRSVAGIRDVGWSDETGPVAGPVPGARAHVLVHLGLAIVDADPDEAAALGEHSRGRHPIVLAAEPELTMRAIGPVLADSATHFADTAELTWGLVAVRAADAAPDGRGARVAVLDTGVDATHPDLAGRVARTASFVPGGAIADGHGHGTHCCGTACGPPTSAVGPRYGVAGGAELWVGKVLGDDGGGPERQILAGLEWAVAGGADVVSMSLGADVATPRVAYERAGARALRTGTLIVAAAGNNADRPVGNVGFVGVPANSSSVMAVAALDPDLMVADFSARGTPADGGRIDLAAPGVAVRSAWPGPPGWRVLSGTSMAAPHVAGTAARWIEATGHRGARLWGDLTRAARPLPEAVAADVGAGCVQAPRPGR